MIIKRLRLHNIRSYLDEEITFPEGSVLLSGDIGAGKSSVLLAIEFALFGTRAELPASSLLRKGKNQGFVELEFQIDGKDVIIRRNLKKNKDRINQTAGYIIVDGVKKDLMPGELKDLVIRILGYPPSLAAKKKSLIYRFTVYTPQEQMKQILFENREERLNTLRKLFGIDRYKTIRDNASIVLSYLKNLMTEEKVRSEGISEKKELLSEEEEKRRKLQQHINSINTKINAIKNEINEEEKTLEILEEKNKVMNQIMNEMKVLESAFNEKQKQLRNYEEKLKLFNAEVKKLSQELEKFKVNFEKQELKKNIETLEGKVRDLSLKLAGLNNELNTLKERSNELSKELEVKISLNEELGKLKTNIEEHERAVLNEEKLLNLKKQGEEELTRIMDEKAKKKAEIETTKKTLDTVSKSDKCPLCLQSITPAYKEKITDSKLKLLEKLEHELEEINEHEIRVRNNLKNLDEQIKQISSIKLTLTKEKERLKNIEEKVASLKQKEEDLIKINKRIKSIENMKALSLELEKHERKLKEMKLLKEKIEMYERLNDKKVEKEKETLEIQLSIKEKQKEIEETKKRIVELKEKLKSYENVESKIEEQRKKLNEMKEALKDEEIKRASLSKELNLVEDNIKKLKDEIDTMEESKKKLARLTSLRYWIEEHFINLIALIEKQVMGTIYHEFNELFKTWFNMLVEDEAINARLDEEFTPIVEQNNYEVEIQTLSGGEKTSLALAYRLALNKVVNDVTLGVKTRDLIILDEPTDGFSTQQLDKVRDVIRELNMKQIIIVSHEQKIESFVDRVIRIMKENHISKVVDQ